jgi:PAS domain S-box-containing protein
LEAFAEVSSARGSHNRFGAGHSLLGIKGLEPGDHLCFIYETEEEHRAVLTSFLRQGLERDERVLYVADAHTLETITAYLRGAGLDVESHLNRGQLVVLTANDSYLRRGTFDPDAMIALMRSETKRALSDGYSALRVTGEMTWALHGLSGSDRLIEYEAKLNSFFPGSRCLTVCQYDRRRFEPKVLLDVLRTHSIAIMNTEVYDNFYYIPPAEMLGPDIAAATFQQWREQLEKRRQAEKSLRQERDFSTTLIRTSPTFIVVIDADGKLIMINETMLSALGYERDDVVGRDYLSTFVPDEERRRLGVVFDNLVHGSGPSLSENHVLARDGRKLLVEWRGAPLVGHDGALRCLFGVGIDITERRKIESELSLKNLVFESSLTANSTADRNGTLTHVNSAFLRTWGCESKEAVIGKPIRDFFKHEREATEILAALDQRKVWEGEFTALRGDGTTFCAYALATVIRDQSGDIVGCQSAVQDITERKRVEQALRRSEERYQTIVKQATDGIFIMSLEGEILEVNDAFAQLHGYTMEELLKIGLSGLDVDGRAPVPGRISRMLGGESLTFEVEHLRKDGSRFPLEVSASIADFGGRKCIMAFHRDITDRKRAEELARRHQTELAHASRLSTVGEMASGIAHELNQPLGAICAYADALEEMDEAARLSQFPGILRKVAEQARRASEIVTRIRSFVRKDTGHQSPADINAIVNESLGFVADEASRNQVRIQLDLAAELPPVQVRRAEIQQVLVNLARNAFDAMADGDLRERTLTVRSAAAENAVVISFSDTGLGFQGDAAERFFEPFFTTKPDGMGLGLPLSRTITESHGGRLWATANPDHGVTFHVLLPSGNGAPR